MADLQGQLCKQWGQASGDFVQCEVFLLFRLPQVPLTQKLRGHLCVEMVPVPADVVLPKDKSGEVSLNMVKPSSWQKGSCALSKGRGSNSAGWARHTIRLVSALQLFRKSLQFHTESFTMKRSSVLVICASYTLRWSLRWYFTLSERLISKLTVFKAQAAPVWQSGSEQ